MTPVVEIQYTDIISRPENVVPVLEILYPNISSLFNLTLLLEIQYLDITARPDTVYHDIGTWINVPGQY